MQKYGYVILCVQENLHNILLKACHRDLIAKMAENDLSVICSGIPVNPLPPKQLCRDASVPHAPILTPKLSSCDFKVRPISKQNYL